MSMLLIYFLIQSSVSFTGWVVLLYFLLLDLAITDHYFFLYCWKHELKMLHADEAVPSWWL